MLDTAERKAHNRDMDTISMIIKAETEGFTEPGEAEDFAQMLLNTGLVNSTGSYGRFVRDMIESGWVPA